MTKDELKIGYLVRYRKGNLAMVMPTDCKLAPIALVSCAWADLDKFDDDLTYEGVNDLDIMEVWGFASHIMDVFSLTINSRKLLWKREEPKKLTVAEIEQILGYKVEIVSENQKGNNYEFSLMV